MAAAGTLGVVGVDRAAVHGGDGVFDVAALVERVGVDGHLHVVAVGDVERRTDRCRGRSPVFVYLESADARFDLFFERLGHRTVALAQHADVYRNAFERFEHALGVPFARSDGRAVGAVGGADAAAEEGGDAVAQRGIGLLRRDEVHVAVDAGRRQNQMLARYGIGRGAGYQVGVHAVHGVGVSRLADAGDQTVLDAHVGLHNAEYGVDDRHVGNDDVERPFLRGHRVGQPHAVAQGFAAAVDDFIAVFAEVLLDLHIQIGVAQADLVAHGRPEKVVVFLT